MTVFVGELVVATNSGQDIGCIIGLLGCGTNLLEI